MKTVQAGKAKIDSSFGAARILASIAIVWVHTPRTDPLNRAMPLGVFATAFFAAAAMFFLARSLLREPGRCYFAYTKHRIVRLGAPFLVWTAFYLAFRNVCRVYITHEAPVFIDPWILLVGSSLQLWFLPFLLIASLIAFPIIKVATRSSHNRHVTAIVLAVLGLVMAFIPLPTFHGPADLARFQRCVWLVTPCVMWGLSVALYYDVLAVTVLRSKWATPVGAAITLVTMLCLCFDYGAVWAKNIGGLGWLLVSLSLPKTKTSELLAKLAPLGFGLYLIHPFIQGVLRAMAQVLHASGSVSIELLFFPLTITGALALSWVLYRNSRTAWLIA